MASLLLPAIAADAKVCEGTGMSQEEGMMQLMLVIFAPQLFLGLVD